VISKLGYYSHYASSYLRYLSDVWPFVICTIMNAFNGLIMIQKEMTLKVHKCLKASSATYVARFVR